MQTSSNGIKRGIEILRGVGVVAVAAVLAPWLWQVTADAGRAAARGAPVRADEALAAVVASAALVGVTWLALGVLLELLSRVPGALGRAAARVADVVTPRLLRRGAAALVGVGLAAGVLPGASVAAPVAMVQAAPAPLPDPGFDPLPDPGWEPEPTSPTVVGRDGGSPTPGPGWVPSPPTVRVHPDVRVLSPAPRPGPAHDAPTEVVVRRGDSLWSIVARHLGPDVSDGEIARAWPAWFEANHAVVGDDPDLLRPGQVLRAPEGVRS
jgi:nucleoid-associated protein YgaU